MQIGTAWQSTKRAWTEDSGWRATLWQNGALIDLNKVMSPQPSAWTIACALDLNDDGVVVGNGSYNGGSYINVPLGYVLTPARVITIVNPSLVGNTFSFTVKDLDNHTCTVQAPSSLTSPSWSTLGTVVVQNGVGVFSDPTAGQYTQRFYRVSTGSLTSGDVVGFLVKTVPAGDSLVACPFETPDNRVPAVFASAPEGTGVYYWDDTEQTYRINGLEFGAWSDPLMTLYPGEGVLVSAPSSFVEKWVGRVRQNCLSKEVSGQYALHGSIAAFGGTVDTSLRFPVANGDTVTLMINGVNTTYTYNNGAWSPSQPSVSLGQGFWSCKTASATWRQNCSVW
jgi:hypothetical protein